MQACPEPCIENLVAKIVRHFEVPYRIQIRGRTGGVEAVEIEIEALCAEKAAEDLGHRRRDRAITSVSSWSGGNPPEAAPSQIPIAE